MRQPLVLLFAILIPLAARGSDGQDTCNDGQLIFELPARAAAARKAAQAGWDSGVTKDMVEATSNYNEALKAMILDLNSTYYAEPATRDAIDEYVSALATVGQFERAAANPRNEEQGTIVAVDAGEQISRALENTVEAMVTALIGEDTDYSLADWKKQWKSATGGDAGD